MIPPIPISSTTFHYTLNALVNRSDDLTRVASLVSHAASLVSAGTGTVNDPKLILIHAELGRLAADISEMRLDIDGVIATIEPSESARATLATGAPWPFLRTPTGWLSANSPWMPVAPHLVPVELTKTATHIDPPHNLTDRLARVPRGESPVRIDRFDTADGPRFEVYIAGTDFAASPRNPWWVGANLSLLSSGYSDSLSAVESALRDAGVTATTPIVITGHSQGGAIGLALANSNRYAVDAIFTVGAPVGLVDEVHEVPQIHVAHPEDPVPALGGTIQFAEGTTWIVHTEPRVVGTDAHVLDSYRRSVAEVDAVDRPIVEHFESQTRPLDSGIARWFRAVSSG